MPQVLDPVGERQKRAIVGHSSTSHKKDKAVSRLHSGTDETLARPSAFVRGIVAAASAASLHRDLVHCVDVPRGPPTANPRPTRRGQRRAVLLDAPDSLVTGLLRGAAAESAIGAELSGAAVAVLVMMK